MHIPFAIVDSRNTTYRNVDFSAAPKLRECAEICHPSAQCIPMHVEGKLTIADSSAPALTALSYLCACPSPHGYPIASSADVAMNGTESLGVWRGRRTRRLVFEDDKTSTLILSS